MTEVTCAT